MSYYGFGFDDYDYDYDVDPGNTLFKRGEFDDDDNEDEDEDEEEEEDVKYEKNTAGGDNNEEEDGKRKVHVADVVCSPPSHAGNDFSYSRTTAQASRMVSLLPGLVGDKFSGQIEALDGKENTMIDQGWPENLSPASPRRREVILEACAVIREGEKPSPAADVRPDATVLHRRGRASTPADSNSFPDHFPSPASLPNSSFPARLTLFEVLGDLAGKLEFGGLAEKEKWSVKLLESVGVEALPSWRRTVANGGGAEVRI
ncbi:hypothetical protein ACLB2K_055236 [Fragaria x ananassa]